MTKYIIFLAGSLLFFIACNGPSSNTINNNRLTDFVDPFIGTSFHGHTYPGAAYPFGQIQLSPDNGTQGWDWCSGYHYSDSTLAGFSHLHLKYSHEQETAEPGYYAVTLKESGIKAEFTVTERVGLHHYSFPEKGESNLLINLGFAINWDKPYKTSINVVDSTLVTGSRLSNGWAADQHVYFAVRFSSPFSESVITNVGGEGRLKVMFRKQMGIKDIQFSHCGTHTGLFIHYIPLHSNRG
jgi:putative alpha-1,2-mannosidase